MNFSTLNPPKLGKILSTGYITFILFAFLSTIIFNTCKHKLSKQLILRELSKAIMILMLVAVSHMMDLQFDVTKNTFRTLTILYYVIHEGLIVLKNAEAIGIPVPHFLRNFLLRSKNNVGNHKVSLKENQKA